VKPAPAWLVDAVKQRAEARADDAAEEANRADAQRWLDEAKASGAIPAEPAPETLALIARILRQHYVEQDARP
jgi:hypothetical protein